MIFHRAEASEVACSDSEGNRCQLEAYFTEQP
jgi:hypothetical protein